MMTVTIYSKEEGEVVKSERISFRHPKIIKDIKEFDLQTSSGLFGPLDFYSTIVQSKM